MFKTQQLKHSRMLLQNTGNVMEQTVQVFLLPCLLVFAGGSVMLEHCEVLSLLAAETPTILYKRSKCGGNYPG